MVSSKSKNGFNCVSCGTHPVKEPGVSLANNENRGFGTAKIARGAGKDLSDADRQRMHPQQYKGRDEHAANSGSNSGLQSRIDTVVAAAGRLDPRCIGFRGHSI